MNKGWLRLMYLAILTLIIVVGWDFVLTSMGYKGEFTETLPTISNQLIPEKLVTHFQKFTPPAPVEEVLDEE